MLRHYQDTFEAFLRENPFYNSPHNLYEPLDYLLALGGKRIRPVLTLLAAELAGGVVTEALDAAMAVELFHNFSLMHDDIMDAAPLRRGKATVHEHYDVNTAILSGDAMLIKAYEYLLKYPSTVSQELMRGFVQTSLQVCEGQQLDMDFEKRDDVTITEYITMITGKTSVLLGEALRLGAIIAGAEPKMIDHAYKFGVNVGIAFQIQDDILDTYGQTNKVGKQLGGDIIQGKKTYLYLKAIELSTPDQRLALQALYYDTSLSTTQKVDKVVAIFDGLHVRLYADEVKAAYRDLAYSHLDMIDVPQDRKSILKDVAQYLLDRAE